MDSLPVDIILNILELSDAYDNFYCVCRDWKLIKLLLITYVDVIVLQTAMIMKNF